MKKSEAPDFEQPRSQSQWAIAIMAFGYIRQFLEQFWFVFIALMFNAAFWKYIIALICILVVIGSVTFAVMAFRRFNFCIRDGSFVLHRGIFRKSRKNVSLRRIQSVHTERNILHRLLNVLELKVDTAGTGEKEFSIPALDPYTAEELRTQLLRERTKGPEEKPESDSGAALREKEERVFTLALGDLIKIGLSQNHLRTFGLIMAFIIGTSNRADDFFETSIYDYLTRSSFWETVMKTSFTFYLSLLVGAVALTLVVSITMALLRYYGLTAWMSKQGLRIERGLLIRRMQSAPIQKIQIFSWVVNPLRKLFGLFTIIISQASSEESNRSQALLIAGVKNAHIDAIRQLIYKNKATDWRERIEVDFSLAWRYALFFSLITAVVTFLLYYYIQLTIWLIIVAVPTVALLSFWYYYNWDIRVNADCLSISRGVFNVRTSIVEWYKLQSVEIRQTPYLARNDLANLSLYTASGEITLLYIDVSSATRLYQYALYKSECTNRSWM